MKEIKKYQTIWEKIVEEIYIQNEEFDYKQVKKIHKKISVYYKNIQKQIEEINITLKLTEFNKQKNVKSELEEFLQYLLKMEKYLQEFIKYEPKTKMGYYNYLKSVISLI